MKRNRWMLGPVMVSLWAVLGIQIAWAGDRIVAVVEDGVILESELAARLVSVHRNLRESAMPPPPEDVLRRQVLDRLVLDRLQVQMAERGGLRVDEDTLRQALQQIAQRNQMTLEQFRAALDGEGVGFQRVSEQVRGEILTGRLRAQQVTSRIKISEREIDAFLSSGGAPGHPAAPAQGRAMAFRLGHILIATPQGASPDQVAKAQIKAERLLESLRRGEDFHQAALRDSADSYALKGGDLGWRQTAELPSLFDERVPTMQVGEVIGPIRSPSGFHLVKLLETRSGSGSSGPTPGTAAATVRTHVRHILLKTSEVLNDPDARQRLETLRRRIEGGEDFATLARAHSDDKGSAVKGGDLGFVDRGALVPAFEEAMSRLADNEIGGPVQTQFGWHLIQVLGRERGAGGQDAQRVEAREVLFRRKADEETELWLRQLRDEAYVEIRLDAAAGEGAAGP